MQSGMHPDFNYTVVDEADLLRQPLLRRKMDAAIEDATAQAYANAKRMVRQYRPAIDAVASELLDADTVYGSRLRELVAAASTVAVAAPLRSNGAALAAPSPTAGATTFRAGAGRPGYTRFTRLVRRPRPHPPAPLRAVVPPLFIYFAPEGPLCHSSESTVLCLLLSWYSDVCGGRSRRRAWAAASRS